MLVSQPEVAATVVSAAKAPPPPLSGTPLISPLEDSVATSELLHAIWMSHTMELRVPVHRAHTGSCAPATWNDRAGS